MLRAAFYETDITPYLFDQMPGQFEVRPAPTVLDHLYAHAFAAENDGGSFIIVSLDSIVIERRDVLAIRKRIMDAVGVENVAVNAIHNHTGGPVAHLYTSERNDRYVDFLIARAADAGILAWQRLAPAKVGFASKDVHGLAFNRRFLFKDGHVEMNPGINNPNVVRGVDVTDPEFLVLRVDDAQGNPMGAVASFALHLDSVGSGGFSADYPGFIRAALQEKYGPRFGFNFLTGCCGNINHVDTTGTVKHNYQTIGRALADEMLGMLENIAADDADAAVAARSRMIEAAIERPTPAMAAAAPSEPRRIQMEIASHLPGGALPCEVQCLRLGENAIVFLPGEVFAAFGLDIKARSAFKNTFTVELSNASNGYVVTREAKAQGGYEATASTYNILDGNAGYLMADAAVENLRELR